MRATKRQTTIKRAQPGTKGGGDYFRVVVRPKEEFVTFRYHDIGDKGHLQRLAGKRKTGTWGTQAWLISKQDAHVRGSTLIPDNEDAKSLLEKLSTKPKHIKGDVFEAKDRPNVPEKAKSTSAQKKAWSQNIKKAIETRHKKT